MKKLILIVTVIFLLVAIVFRPKNVEVLPINPFEEERKTLIEKYPDDKFYTLEELEERSKLLTDLRKRELEKYKEEERERKKDGTKN